MDKNIQRHYMQNNAWGMEVALDLLNVELNIIKNEDQLKRYAKDLVELIDMKAFGETQLVHFGSCPEVQGYTMVQMIETSLISAHFAELTSAAYINVFSCKPFDPDKVLEFSINFFNAKEANMHIMIRKGKKHET